jgi:molybdopterin-guanine dinucleotide biosynthesis protein A
MADRSLYGLVLAGGRSLRMGTDKALLVNAGESQLARAMRLLDGLLERSFVSTSEAQKDEPERASFPQILDRYADLGPVAGILSAMDAHPEVDWLVVACDLPNLSVAVLERLIAEDTASPFTAYRSVHNGLPEPLCAIYRRESRSLLDAFVGDGVKCPRKMMINSDTRLLDQVDAHALDNVNTPDDLESSVLVSGS